MYSTVFVKRSVLSAITDGPTLFKHCSLDCILAWAGLDTLILYIHIFCFNSLKESLFHYSKTKSFLSYPSSLV